MTDAAITKALHSIRQQIDELELLINAAAIGGPSEADLPIFDPDHGQPPVTPLVDGSRAQQDWCGLMLWAPLVLLNIRQNRGATHEESVAIAQRAGYRDGRAWNKWTGSSVKDENGDRWATKTAAVHLRHYYPAVARQMPTDLADWCAKN